MIPKIFTKVKKKVEQPIQFRLSDEIEYDGIQLVAVNEEGGTLDCGIVLSILPEGVIQLAAGLDVDGIKTVGNEYIKVTKG